jgi:hypothetical protein
MGLTEIQKQTIAQRLRDGQLLLRLVLIKYRFIAQTKNQTYACIHNLN